MISCVEVERTEPVGGVDGALNNGQESEDDPVLYSYQSDESSCAGRKVVT